MYTVQGHREEAKEGGVYDFNYPTTFQSLINIFPRGGSMLI
jgi:hypothetical protein